jgi:hypothetical protein
LSAAGAGGGGGELGGVIGVGARADFGGACFLAAGGAAGAAAGAAAVAGRAAVPAAGAAARGGAADPGAPGSGVMMLTGGVDEADGKSIMVVGLPVGTPAGGGSAAIAPDGTAAIAGIEGGAPQDAE